jgi:hypothetical protein
MEIDKKNLLVVSCIFGNRFQTVYEAPLDKNCFFFTNNYTIKQEVENKNWNYVYIPFELSDDSIKSSCQSKYIKFLTFLDDYPEYRKYQTILYFDHKVFVKEEHINQLISISARENNQYAVIIRSHESQPRNIWDEVEDAKHQERYANNMNTTIEMINHKIKNDEFNEKTKICNTGLLFYVNYEPIKSMLHNIYSTCVELLQPECQILWAIYSQPFLDKIKCIDFYTLDLLWREPFGSNKEEDSTNKRILYFIIIMIIAIVIILLVFPYVITKIICKKSKLWW